MNVIKPIISFLIIAIISSLLVIFDKKIQLKKIYKQLIYGVIFGAIAVGCNFLLVDTYLGLANSAIIVGGIIFGGPCGLVAGFIAGLERFFAIYYGASFLTRFPFSISLLLAGLFAFFISKLSSKNENIKWYYGSIVSLIIESFNLLLIFIFNINDLALAYEIVSSMVLFSLLLNILTVTVILIGVGLLNREKLFKLNKPRNIQSKIQLNLAISMLVGFAAVTSIAYGVLDNSSKEATKSTLQLTMNDVATNVTDDVNEYFLTIFNKHNQNLKTTGLWFDDLVNKREMNDQNLKGIDPKNNISATTIIAADGTIVMSSNEYITNMKNISELNIAPYDNETGGTVLIDYQYYEQLHDNYVFIFGRYRSNKPDYYVLCGVSTELYSSYYIKNSIDKGIPARHVGEKGYILMTDLENNVLCSPTDEIKDCLPFNPGNENEINQINFNDSKYYSTSRKYHNYKIVAITNKEESDLNKNIAIYITSLTEVIVFFVLYAIIYFSINYSVISPLKRVNTSLDNISKGNLNEKVNELTSKEFLALSNDINSTVDSLKEYMGREAKLIKKDLDFAQSIQTSVLPKLTKEYSENSSFDIFASMNAAKEVGGDFYDFQLLDDKHLFILIADVSGKGVPAAMFMMQSKTIIKTLVENSSHIDEAITKANAKLCENNAAGMFVTCWCAVINLETGVMEYVNAGHNPPLIKKNNGEFVYLSAKPSFVLAGLDFFKYSSSIIQFEKGDQLFLYTDGVTEAYSVNDELFGENRLLECAKNITTNKSSEFCEIILKNVREYAEGKEQSDDITMLHFMYRGFSK